MLHDFLVTHRTELIDRCRSKAASRRSATCGPRRFHPDSTIEHVVHDYGDLVQSITELATERGAPITVREFGLLSFRVDQAMARAVSEYAGQQALARSRARALAAAERSGRLCAEMRELVDIAILAISAIKRGGVGFGGATAASLDRSLNGMRELVDRSLGEVRTGEGAMPTRKATEPRPPTSDVQVAAGVEASPG